MDTEKLISAVQEHPPLWDMRNKCYHRRDIQRKLWANIADEIGAQVEAVKKKWQGLRDTFRKEYNKAEEHRSGEEATDNRYSSWPYFEQMWFLKDVVSHRKLQGNTSPEKSTPEENHCAEAASASDLQHIAETENNVSVLIHSEESNFTPLSVNPNAAESLQPLGNRRKKKRKRNAEKYEDEPYLELERRKIELLTESAALKQNSDYQFLQSLLPFLMKIPSDRKLTVRNKLTQVLIDEEETDAQPPQSSPPDQSAPSPFSYSSQSDNTTSFFVVQPSQHNNSTNTAQRYFSTVTFPQ